jgi:hypothetical protein
VVADPTAEAAGDGAGGRVQLTGDEEEDSYILGEAGLARRGAEDGGSGGGSHQRRRRWAGRSSQETMAATVRFHRGLC